MVVLLRAARVPLDRGPAVLVFWEESGVVRLVERDPLGTVTFLHEVRIQPAFLASG